MSVANGQLKTVNEARTNRQSATGRRQLLAWQGWQLRVPDDWNPVKVDGDYEVGSLLIADLHGPRLGLRWRGASRKGDPAKWADRAMRQEVGQLAAQEASAYKMPGSASDWRVSRLYTEPEPPGRDVWLGWSERSGRVLEVVYHAKRRDRVLADDVLPTLADTKRDEALDWSIFDLSVRSPAGLTLQWYKLNAGDLSLAFSEKRGRKLAVVRQIGPASLALARQPLEGWMSQQHYPLRKLYRPMGLTSPAAVTIGDRELPALRATLCRRRRLFWLWLVAPEIVLLGLHDPDRKRLVIGQGEDEPAVRQLLRTVGWTKN